MKNFVSQSVYQKTVEENKRLKKMLKILCFAPGIKAIMLRIKLRDSFKKEDGLNQAINAALKKAARQYFIDHPENAPKSIPRYMQDVI